MDGLSDTSTIPYSTYPQTKITYSFLFLLFALLLLFLFAFLFCYPICFLLVAAAIPGLDGIAALGLAASAALRLAAVAFSPLFISCTRYYEEDKSEYDVEG